MSAPQLTDPGASGEWFRVVEETRSNAAARRQRFARLVTYTMVGLTAFSVLGLACFAWRRHSLQSALETPPPAPLAVAAPAAAPPTALVAAAPISPPALPEHAASPVAAPAPTPLAKAKATTRKKAPARGSTFLKGSKPQPAALKRR